MKTKINTFTVKQSYLFYLLYFYPAIATLLLNWLHEIKWSFSDFLENCIFTLFLLGLSTFISNPYKKIYFVFLYLLLTIIAFVETSYYYLYKSVISSASIFIFLETNRNEALEYITNYSENLNALMWFIVVPAGIIIPLIIYTKTREIHSHRILRFTGLIVLLISMYALKITKYNLPYTVVKSSILYNHELRKYESLAANIKGGAFNNVKHTDTTKKMIYVLVIGESSVRNHMSLYGYYRKTNPFLSEIQNELIIYQDVISPHANTISSLQKALTLGNYDYPEGRFKGTIIQLFNKAGFTTYWISNQQPIGIHETGITKLTKSCTKRFFLNTRSNRKESIFDENILNVLQKVLNESINKQFIIIHLLGSHVDYKNRYPEKFNKFIDTPHSKFKNKRAYQMINEYDNSILYTDYILNEIIKLVRNKQLKSYMLYFSDHGEDVFETENKAFHAEGIKSKYMYEVPFILWRSNIFKQTNNMIVFDVNRKYMLDDLIYSISDLSSIKFDEFDMKKSIFNQNFEYKNRIILDSLNYDLFF
jgi:heptose-I-phosphate ethanolaminephosphotransferase